MEADVWSGSLRALWREAERRSYPLATTSPEKYERVVRIARRVADDLAGISTDGELIDAWQSSDDAVRVAASGIGVPIGDLSPADIAGVGFALREAEIRALDHQRAQQQLVAEARGRGDRWALLFERGDLARGLLDAYQAIELHLASGLAIVSSVEPDPSTGTANHVLTVIRMDGDTGVLIEVDPGVAEVQEITDPDEFVCARAALVDLIDSL